MIDLDKFDVLLDINDPNFANKLRKEIGVGDGESIEIATPQFERIDDMKIKPPLFDFEKLHNYSDEQLRAIGCLKWDDDYKKGNVLWLYPYQWYDYIPEGHEMMCIDGKKEIFKKGVTDNDMRFGVLAYGLLRKESI